MVGIDISSAYLCAKTSKKVCIEADPEFGSQAGRLLIVDKALYGLRLSVKAFNHLLTNVLRPLRFEPSRAEPSIYINPYPDPTKDIYEYVASYVDNLCYVVSYPKKFLEDLQNNKLYNFDLKRSGEVNFHLRYGFVQDCTCTMCMDTGRYVDKMCNNYSKLSPGSPI